ncbi:hypothetical protein AUJ68_06125 [Candidatus Woesearchaeota archaeon CG1_02_57_44]|nr:MAG: hypothetical protein AUJ68_06125 [Candidatus Woesearchaeota archaeon CG1_02_57_44]
MHMIGKPEWFTYRILGWGIRPKTKEGWLYIVGFIAVILAIAYLPVADAVRQAAIGVVVAVLVIDTLSIMVKLDSVHDERERMHQLIIERNCSFAAIVALLVALFWQGWQAQQGGMTTLSLSGMDPWLFGVLGVMLLAKIGTTLALRAR